MIATYLFALCLSCLYNDIIIAKSIQNGTNADIKNEDILNRLEMVELGLKNMSTTIIKMLEEEKHQKTRPMFMVKLSRDNTVLNTYSIIKFDVVVLDVGGDFNSGDGVFVAPVSGVYMFSWTIQEYSGKLAYTELRVDNAIKATLHVVLTGNEGRNTATRIMFCNVKKGDHVWIQTTGTNSENFFDIYYGSSSSFMGILMKRT